MQEKPKMTTSQYAAHRGVSVRAVQAAIKEGRIKEGVSKPGTRYEIDWRKADREWAKNTESKNDSSRPGMSLADAKIAKLEWETKISKLNYLERKSQLVEKQKVYEALFKIGKQFREKFQAIPDRVIDNLLAARSRHEAHTLLYNAIAAELKDLSNLGTPKI